ncbi:flagellar hook assembly protein FlgD [Roseomonas sp. 18066]|uniref:flagellar hook assembly protein FlgD n=1 Tax=Roseomonas sp. 18066 TaxID=2681412 RepID=UPI00135A568B|nr:flagellar hook assembly protein FlgD [Roseomonas sp. 18066]
MATTAAVTTASTTSTTSTKASASAGTKLAGDMQSFLVLLTTQLQNQDPTNPTDSTQFTTQLAQFSAVEQQIATNAHLETLLSLQQSSSMLSATALVGRNVEINSETMVLQDGETQSVKLPALSGAGGASTAIVTIANASGTTVRTATVALGSDASSWNWDGTDSNGRSLADGKYTVTVAGADSKGASTGSLTSTLTGAVTSVTRTDGNPTLTIGGLTVSMDKLVGLQ